MRYGGEYYDKLNKPCISGQFWLYTMVEFVIGSSISVLGWYFVFSQQMSWVFIFTGISVFINVIAIYFTMH